MATPDDKAPPPPPPDPLAPTITVPVMATASRSTREEINLDDPLRRPGAVPPCTGGEAGQPPLPPLQLGYERYRHAKPLGAGGVGTVSSCYDPNLGRHIALKELHPRLRERCEQRARFFREARITAQLQHPNIMPVYEFGVTPAGNAYYTMKRVSGLSLQTVLNALRTGDPYFVAEYPRSRLLDIFTHVGEAIAFAHSRGVIHRDLKPENILLGSFGEVLVTDWGLVKVLGERTTTPGAPPPDDGAIVAEEHDTHQLTLDGMISGTPLYMSPEQALGEVDQLDQRSDVYSLGALLYEVLTFEKTVAGTRADEIMGNVIAARIVPPRRRAPRQRVPRDLDAICMKALAREPEHRYPGVSALLNDLARYRQGLPVSVRPYSPAEHLLKHCLRHPVISASLLTVVVVLAVVAAALVTWRYSRYTQLVRLADQHRTEGAALYAQRFQLYRQLLGLRERRLQKEPPPDEVALAQRLATVGSEAENAYRTAEMLYVYAAPRRGDPRVDTAMGEIFTNRLNFALLAEDYQLAEQHLALLRTWLGPTFEQAPPVLQATLRHMVELVEGRGVLAVTTDPPGAEAELENLDAGAAAPGVLGLAPLPRFSTPKGNYLLTLSLPDRPPVRYPLFIKHGQVKEVTVRLPRATPPGAVFVPAGSFLVGGEQARHYRLHEVYLDDYFIQAHEVTFAEYLAFYQEAVAAGPQPGLLSRVQLAADVRRYDDAWDAEGRLLPPLRPEWPVVGITCAAAEQYCAWLATRLGRPVRLPTADEWEKAARGVDGRPFVWGQTYDPSYAFLLENAAARAQFGIFAPPGSLPHDRSIYGAWDMAGNVREWTASRFPDNSPFFQVKGASAATTQRFAYCAYSSDTPVVPTDIGFRCLLPVVPELDF
jgi:serine/threonine-protein kinase